MNSTWKLEGDNGMQVYLLWRITLVMQIVKVQMWRLLTLTSSQERCHVKLIDNINKATVKMH